MSRSLHPPCAGSVFYGPHSAKVPAAFTVICPGGKVVYACDTDCLKRIVERREEENMGTDRPIRCRGVRR